MKFLFLIVSMLLLANPPARAAVGVYAGAGVPLNLQVGLTYRFNPSFLLEVSYNKGNSLTDCRDFELKIAQLGLNYYPFGESLFIGAGAGYTTLYASNLNPANDELFWFDAEAVTAYEKLGWTWDISDGGFWFGIDVSVYQALSSKRTDHADGVDTTSRPYRASSEAVTRFTDSSHMNITVARLGWTF